jgi:Na+-transporting NADH:ubiquinone oxidoreductase subunit E
VQLPRGQQAGRQAIGLGIAVVFVQAHDRADELGAADYILAPGALAWAGFPDTDLSYLQFLTFIATIAAVVQIVEMAIDKFSPKLYAGARHLPAADRGELRHPRRFAVHGAEAQLHFPQAVVYGFGSGLGWALAIVSMAAIRWKMRTSARAGPCAASASRSSPPASWRWPS